LGGKNPTIVDESCDVATAAAKIMWARNYNSGQICMCPDYVIVHSKVKEEFLECCKKEISNYS
jgi:aldehyde dehydrogenase (NAD+)